MGRSVTQIYCAFMNNNDCINNSVSIVHYLLSLDARKPDFVAWERKDADQPAHVHSLISTFIIHLR